MTKKNALSWFVYLLRCEGGSLYTGMTNDLDKRLAAHANGSAARYTRARLPVSLVYHENQPTRSAALKREATIKKMTRTDKLELIENERAGQVTRSKRRRPRHSTHKDIGTKHDRESTRK